jgi:tetratricopeptide (TPR) repeat protein
MRFAISLSLLLLIGAPAVPAQVRVWEGTMNLPASDEGPPSPNPPFDSFQVWKYNYPYTMREDIRPTESMHAWRALYLENEFLKCSILPDLGGHLYTCIDKINGKSMFNANPSIKKALIGYRGAWAAFGIEFDFPISHNWVTLSPVDWAYSANADGSASVTVGNRDRVYGMEWTVELVLRPKSTVLEERVTLTNRSDLRRRYYWWNNAGVQVWDDSRICYPMQFSASHGFKDIDTWPVDHTGKDLSLFANQTDGGVSRFAYGSREPFMGIYHPHIDAGVVHYANYADVPARKIFTWGVTKEGVEWRETLSDNHSAYAEVQGGLLINQETYAFLESSQVIRFSEFWMPVREIGTISSANLDGVVALRREPQPGGKAALIAAFNANHAIRGATIKILDGESALFSETASLDPARTWTHRIENVSPDKKYTFLLEDAKSEALMRFTENTYDWTPADQVHTGPQAAYKEPPQESWMDGDFLNHGMNQELSGNPAAAWETYQSGLAKAPTSFELLKASGRVAVSLLRYEEASSQLAKVEARDTSDPEIHYYRGIAEQALSDEREARLEFEAAYRDPSFRTAAGLLLAELLAQEHDPTGALKVLQDSCHASTNNARCAEETVALERAAGQASKARELAHESLVKYPTSSFLRNELRIPSPSNAPSNQTLARELDHHLAADSNWILYLATQYDRLGLDADAVELLSRNYPTVPPEQTEPGAIPPANDPLLAYFRGFYRQKLGQSAAPDFDAASRMPLLYVFPNEPGTLPVLRAALAANPNDASAQYLLGTLLFSRGIVDPAIEEWRHAEQLNPKIPSLDASLGLAFLDIKKRPADAVAVFQRGISVDAANPALYLGLDKALKELGKPPSARVEVIKSFPATATMPEDLLRALVVALREDGKDAEADALLAKQFMPRKEGQAPLTPTGSMKK